jgi:murein DD-endopeptidase MepM/ murein hydrolase activator NlpD
MLVTTLLLLVTGGSCLKDDSGTVTPAVSDGLPGEDSLKVSYIYGFVPDTFIPEPGRIARNQLISELLLSKGFSYPEIDVVLANNSGSFDPRKVRSGNNYTFYSSSDTALRPSYLVYEHDNTLSHIFSLGDNPGINDYRHETRHEIRFVEGFIESSLWEAVIAAGANPLLAVELSEIYAWSIDFFGLQKGDSFRVIYEEVFTADKSAGITSVNAAIFTHAGKDFIAIPFYQDDKVSYYDEAGNSLRKAFLKAPLRFTRISSGYSSGRLHPILKVVRPHHGVDYAAPVGTPVVAIGDGRVVSASYEPAEGRIVRIRHNSVYSTSYMHLSSFAGGISAGTWVRQGDVIGYVGSSGLSTGPHLDFRFYKNGTPVDPLKVEAPPVEPVAEENRERFSAVLEMMVLLLRNI